MEKYCDEILKDLEDFIVEVVPEKGPVQLAAGISRGEDLTLQDTFLRQCSFEFVNSAKSKQQGENTVS